jgi:hypothetical protein
MPEQRKRFVGRPTKRTPETVARLMKAISTGAPYRICCSASGIAYDTFMDWKAADPEFDAQVEEAASRVALRILKKIEAQVDQNFAAGAWILERRFPREFSRPEVQFNFEANVVQNNLSITISPQEVEAIECQAEPVRAKVRQMCEEYLRARGGGNGEEAPSAPEVSESVARKFADYRPNNAQ